MNEASQISFQSYEIIISRLNPPKGLRGKIIIDYNPPSSLHWGYQIFHKRKFPKDGRDVPGDNFKCMTINPADNLENIDPGYLKRLEQLSTEKRNRFLYGKYSTDSGALWKRHWLKCQTKIPDLERIVIGVDPSGSVGSDEIGIVVAGKAGDTFYILDDCSMHGTPAEWAKEVSAAFDKWQADLVVAEKNYGGDMVEHTIRTAAPLINVRLITSSRGKVLRAEPVSALYEQGRVYHREEFMELEDEYCIFSQESDFSPNRLDAAVFALTELSGASPSMLDAVS